MDGRALLLVSLAGTVAWSGPKVDFRGEIQPLLRENCLGRSTSRPGFLHGPDQLFSMAASNWASMAPALAGPARESFREQRRPVDHERQRLRVPFVLPCDGEDPLAVR